MPRSPIATARRAGAQAAREAALLSTVEPRGTHGEVAAHRVRVAVVTAASTRPDRVSAPGVAGAVGRCRAASRPVRERAPSAVDSTGDERP